MQQWSTFPQCLLFNLTPLDGLPEQACFEHPFYGLETSISFCLLLIGVPNDSFGWVIAAKEASHRPVAIRSRTPEAPKYVFISPL